MKATPRRRAASAPRPDRSVKRPLSRFGDAAVDPPTVRVGLDR
jgi:hypothetical protein